LHAPQPRRSPLKAGRIGLALGLVLGAGLGLAFLPRLSAGDRAREVHLRSLVVIAGTSGLVGGTIGGFLGVFVGAVLAERGRAADRD
jgi:hypothetical protein